MKVDRRDDHENDKITETGDGWWTYTYEKDGETRNGVFVRDEKGRLDLAKHHPDLAERIKELDDRRRANCPFTQGIEELWDSKSERQVIDSGPGWTFYKVTAASGKVGYDWQGESEEARTNFYVKNPDLQDKGQVTLKGMGEYAGQISVYWLD
jgi:hypothetical protein